MEYYLGSHFSFGRVAIIQNTRRQRLKNFKIKTNRNRETRVSNCNICGRQRDNSLNPTKKRVICPTLTHPYMRTNRRIASKFLTNLTLYEDCYPAKFILARNNRLEDMTPNVSFSTAFFTKILSKV